MFSFRSICTEQPTLGSALDMLSERNVRTYEIGLLTETGRDDQDQNSNSIRFLANPETVMSAQTISESCRGGLAAAMYETHSSVSSSLRLCKSKLTGCEPGNLQVGWREVRESATNHVPPFELIDRTTWQGKGCNRVHSSRQYPMRRSTKSRNSSISAHKGSQPASYLRQGPRAKERATHRAVPLIPQSSAR